MAPPPAAPQQRRRRRSPCSSEASTLLLAPRPLQLLLLLLLLLLAGSVVAADGPPPAAAAAAEAAGAAAATAPAAAGGTNKWQARPLALVNPVAGTSHLKVADEGLAMLRAIDGPVAPVVVIGPYRSGKSFLLNQLLGVGCDKGFGVGHTRETETKGIWVWGEPQQVPDGRGGTKALLFIDTEGFESTGRANSYDDRVFAVATLLSSLLVYNLPETIRGSDVTKLSFVVELAQGFYSKATTADGGSEDAGALPVEPGSMLWLIQRDFLKGKSVQALVDEALAPVPNPNNDKAIGETNAIRASLASIAKESRGFSLPQPHLDRTRLCDLPDSQLDARYVAQRDALRALVRSTTAVKAVAGEPLSGTRLAALLTSLVAALNSKEIPTGAGLIESFNREIVARALALYERRLDAAVKLPAEADALAAADQEARAAAGALFKEQLLGRRQAGALQAQLDAAIDKEAKARRTANVAESNAVCQALELECMKALDAALSGAQLPSMFQFEGRHAACGKRFDAGCVGPARAGSAERLALSWKRARSQFGKDYNDRLFSGLLMAAGAMIVVFRLVVRVPLLEFAGWCAVLALEVWPRLALGGGSMYDTRAWRATQRAWEGLMMVLFGAGGLFVWLLGGAALAFAWARARRRRGAARKKGALLIATRAGGGGDVRDLDV